MKLSGFLLLNEKNLSEYLSFPLFLFPFSGRLFPSIPNKDAPFASSTFLLVATFASQLCSYIKISIIRRKMNLAHPHIPII